MCHIQECYKECNFISRPSSRDMDSYENVYTTSFLTEGDLCPVSAVVSAATANCDLTGKVKTTNQMHKKRLKKSKAKDKKCEQLLEQNTVLREENEEVVKKEK